MKKKTDNKKTDWGKWNDWAQNHAGKDDDGPEHDIPDGEPSDESSF